MIITCNRYHRGIPRATFSLYNKVVLYVCLFVRMCALGSSKLPNGNNIGRSIGISIRSSIGSSTGISVGSSIGSNLGSIGNSIE